MRVEKKKSGSSLRWIGALGISVGFAAALAACGNSARLGAKNGEPGAGNAERNANDGGALGDGSVPIVIPPAADSCLERQYPAPLKGEIEPLSVRADLRVTDSAPRKVIFDAMSDAEKELLYHLSLAGRAGRDLIYYQSHRHALALRSVLEKSVDPVNAGALAGILSKFGAESGAASARDEALKEWRAYAAIYQENGGPYHSSNRKYVLSKVLPTQVCAILATFGPGIERKDSDEIVQLLTSPGYEVLHGPIKPDFSDLALTGGNIYQKGITAQEVEDAVSKDKLNIELNCRVVKDAASGKLACEKMVAGAPTPAGPALVKVAEELQKAHDVKDAKTGKPVLSGEQLKQTELMIRYLREGRIQDFRDASIAWVKDGTSSKIDFQLGFVEVYDDYRSSVGTWESYVQIVDPEITRISKGMAANAKNFEAKMPYDYGNGVVYRKTFPDNYSPPAIMAYYFQELANMRSGGYNLPNFDDIRETVGFKNVIRLDLPGSGDALKDVLAEAYPRFYPADQVERLLQDREKVWQILVLLHEIIGHGSGTYNKDKYPNKPDGTPVDPISALGRLGNALEEQRADIAALVFVDDALLLPKSQANPDGVGFYSSAEEAKRLRGSLYDYYLGDFLRRYSAKPTVEEAHARGHWLYVNWLLERKAIEWVNNPTGEPILKVKDYDAYQEASRALLKELQRIKAERDTDGLSKIFATYAPTDLSKETWPKSVVERGKNLKFMAEAVEQPWSIVQDAKGFRFETCGGLSLETLSACSR